MEKEYRGPGGKVQFVYFVTWFTTFCCLCISWQRRPPFYYFWGGEPYPKANKFPRQTEYISAVVGSRINCQKGLYMICQQVVIVLLDFAKEHFTFCLSSYSKNSGLGGEEIHLPLLLLPWQKLYERRVKKTSSLAAAMLEHGGDSFATLL